MNLFLLDSADQIPVDSDDEGVTAVCADVSLHLPGRLAAHLWTTALAAAPAVTSRKHTGLCLNIKTIFRRYGDSHVKDKKITRPSYL